MAKLTLDALRKLRDKSRDRMKRRETDGKDIRIIVGMGTCGIAAGAKETLDALVDALDKQGVDDAVVKQTGCMGTCTTEPNVEVIVPDMPTVIYGNVDPEVARSIVQDHIIGKKLVSDHVQDRPAADICK
jgi:NADP-reducing hydrogenase subunit HndB